MRHTLRPISIAVTPLTLIVWSLPGRLLVPCRSGVLIVLTLAQRRREAKVAGTPAARVRARGIGPWNR